MIIADFQNCFILVLLCLFSFLYYSLFSKKPKDSKAGFDLPCPPSLPIIGHLHHLLSVLPHKSFQKLSSKYGPLLRIRIFNVPIVLVSSASVASEILRTYDVNVSTRGAPPIDEALILGSTSFALAPFGYYWKFMRKLIVTKLLGPQALERLRGSRASELERFHAALLDKVRKNETVEIAKVAIKLTYNSICKMIMGRSYSEENGEAERARGLILETFAILKKFLLATLLRKPLEKLGILLFKKEIMGVFCRFDELLEKIIVEHEHKPDHDHGMDMMDVLLAAYGDENAEYKITKNHIKSLVVELILAGTETSAQTIQWTMAEIINNPNILERLRGEIDSVVGEARLIQETDLPNLPYLQAVVKEALRLYPPIPVTFRTVDEECNIRGFYIPKNTTLATNHYALMRDPDFWEDPDEFKPERFLVASSRGQEEERDRSLKYIPFGSRRRGCPGVNLAYIFVETAIGMMVQCFDWRIKGDKVNMEETVSGVSLSMAHPLTCTPVARPQPLNSNLHIPINSQA